MKIAIHGRNIPLTARQFISTMLSDLAAAQVDLQVSAEFANALIEAGIDYLPSKVYFSPKQIFDAMFIVSIGGDGTLLETVAHVGARQIPVVGINVGRLGFLATISPDRIGELLNALEKGKYRIETRTLIEVESGSPLFDGLNFGLNDCAITKTDSSSMITVDTYLNGEFLNSYWADGMILSTPTGSTGYSLSCGGAVLVPSSKNFILTPVSPHNLNVRPLVVDDSAILSFEVKSRSLNYMVSLDSRSAIVDTSTKLTVRKAAFVARLAKLFDDNFFSTLRNKLSWGLDARN